MAAEGDEPGAAKDPKAPTKKQPSVSRRRFIVGSLAGGTGVLLGVAYLGRDVARRELFAYDIPPSFEGDASDPRMWFEIDREGGVRLFSPKVEMGQGTLTGLAQIAADELEIDVSRIQVLHADSDRGNLDHMSTGGSLSIAGLWMPLRVLSATMREMLRLEAARKLGVDAALLRVADGVFSGAGHTMTYAQVVEDVEVWEVPSPPALKDPGSYRFVGSPVARIDLRAKVFAEPIFGMDATTPGMAYGAVLRPERVGARLLRADTGAARAMPGVLAVVVEDDFVGVVAESRMQAERAKEAIDAQWHTEHVWQTRHVEELIRVGRGTPMDIQLVGSAASILERAAGGDDHHRAEYTSPIGAHAQLEPNGALAHFEDGRVTVTMSTQVVKVTRDEVAQRLGLAPEQVTIVPTYLGGGFGRRLHTPNAMQAAVLSRAVGRPVKCFFTRKEEFQNDTFRPPTHHVLSAKFSRSGVIEAIEHHVSSGDVLFGSALFPPLTDVALRADPAAFRGGMIQYGAIPNIRAVSWRVRLPFATSWWRGLGLLANTFAVESFLDELALRVGRDPIELRLAHLADDEAGRRLRAVIEAAAERAGYRDTARDGRAMGFACSTDGGTPAAHVAEVSIREGEVRVDKVTCALDPGLAVNPDQVAAQCEGSVIMGLSAAMYERMDIVDGALQPTIYGPYRMATMRDAPREIDVVLLDGTGVPGPVGEPPMGPIGAAIANAIARLTGQRLRSMPLVVG